MEQKIEKCTDVNLYCCMCACEAIENVTSQLQVVLDSGINKFHDTKKCANPNPAGLTIFDRGLSCIRVSYI